MKRYNLFEIPHIPNEIFKLFSIQEREQFVECTKQSMINNIETLKEMFFISMNILKMMYPGVNDEVNMWWSQHYINEAKNSLDILKDEVNKSTNMKNFQEFKIQTFGVINGRIANIIYNVCNKFTPKEFLKDYKTFYNDFNFPKLAFVNDDVLKLFSGWHCVLEYTLDDIEMVTHVFRGKRFETVKFYIDLEDAFEGRESL